MKRIMLASLMLFLCLPGLFAHGYSAYDLRCEYLSEPLAVNTLTPKFSWKTAAAERGFMQSGYEIIVADNEKDIKMCKGNMWRKKMPGTSESLHILYEGAPLSPGRFYYWRVRIFNGKGKASPWSAPQRFGVGLLDSDDWEDARWIAMEIMPEKERIVPGLEFNKLKTLGDRKTGLNKLPQFRKEIEIRKPVRNAIAYVSGLGQFEFNINGEKVGNHFLDPAWTDFDRTVTYVPFDVSARLLPGRNVIGIMLGNGYASIPRERYYKALISYCYPMMILKMTVEYEDGTSETFVSDTSWKTTESPITYSSIYGGEDYDATKIRKGCWSPYYDDSDWQTPLIAEQLGKLVAQSTHPVEFMQRFPFVSVRKTKYGKWLYDLGQNFAGVVQFTVKGRHGQKISANVCELFDPLVDSITTHGGYRGEYRLSYTLGSENSEVWHPRFTYYGFRYVLVSGAVPAGVDNPDGLPVIEDLCGLHARNSTPAAGTFMCSNELLNKTHDLIEWGIKGNMVSYFTDCPHREKLPWIEQLHLMFGSLQYSFDIYKLIEKMTDDMELAQRPNGLIPDITPMYVQFLDGFMDSPEWGSAFILAPWKVYEYYGDPSLVAKHYDAMKRYMEYLESKADDHILSHGLGDWCDIGPKYPGRSQLTSLAATATPIYYMDAVTMKKAAELLGHKEDAAKFEELATNIRKSYNEKYYDKQGGYYDRNSQAANAMAIYAGLVEPGDKQAVLGNLIHDIRAHNNGLTAGDVGFNYVMRALEENGASDVIFDMNSRYDVYGYGYMLSKGATALPESWTVETKKSHNHLMLGHLHEWFYSYVLGIRMDGASTGFKSVTVRPEPVGDLLFADGSFESPYGTISNSWKITDNGFVMKVEIPANTTAHIYIPADSDALVTESGLDVSEVPDVEFVAYKDGYFVYRVGGGVYRFEARSLSPSHNARQHFGLL